MVVTTGGGKIYLKVPSNETNIAVDNGARFNWCVKKWFVLHHVPPELDKYRTHPVENIKYAIIDDLVSKFPGIKIIDPEIIVGMRTEFSFEVLGRLEGKDQEVLSFLHSKSTRKCSSNPIVYASAHDGETYCWSLVYKWSTRRYTLSSYFNMEHHKRKRQREDELTSLNVSCCECA